MQVLCGAGQEMGDLLPEQDAESNDSFDLSLTLSSLL